MGERPEPPGRNSRGPDEPENSRRRLTVAEVFGDVLPDATSDERSPEPNAEGAENAREREFLRDVPPHHQ